MVKIWTNEGERIINLTDVAADISQEDLCMLVLKQLTPRQAEVVNDVPFECVIVGGPLDVLGPADDFESEDKKVNEYIDELKIWADSVLAN